MGFLYSVLHNLQFYCEQQFQVAGFKLVWRV